MTTDTWKGRPARSLLSGNEEDRFTYYLCDLLRSAQVRQAFLSDLCAVTLSLTETATLSVRTQVAIPRGRADLIIRGPNLYLIIEAKVGAWLHGDQTVVYARELDQWAIRNPSGTARLYFLVPAKGASFLLGEACSQIASAGLAGNEPKLIRWEDIAAFCQRLARTVQDRRLSVHLEDFADLVECRIGPAERPFTAEEAQLLADPLVALALARARSLTPRIVGLLPRDGASGIQTVAASGPRWDGFTLRRDGRWWWIGLWMDVWANIGESPLVLQLPGLQSDSLRTLPESLPLPVPSPDLDNPGFILPLSLRPQIELDRLAEEHAQVVKSYCLEVTESGGVGED